MYRLILLPVLAALLSACVSSPKEPLTAASHENWQQRQFSLQPFNEWSIRGRVVLYVEEDVYHLGLGWQRQNDHHILQLEASLGQGMIRLEKHGDRAEMTTTEGDHYYGDNAQQLLAQVTQLTIPVEGLQSWIKGIGHPHSPLAPEIDADGRAVTLNQDGWEINYLEYEQVSPLAGAQLELPHKLYLKRDQLALKIVIDQWIAPPPANPSPLFPDFPD